MDLNVTVLGLLYLVAGIFTFRFLKKSGMTLAATAYAIAGVVLSLYLPVAAGCNLMVRLVELFADSATAAYFAEFIGEPLGVLNSYVTISYVATLVISLFLTFSAVFLAIKVVGAVRELTRREPLSFRRKIKQKICFPADSAAEYAVPFRYVFCRYNC